MKPTHETDDDRDIATTLRAMIEAGEIEVLCTIDGEPVLRMRKAPERVALERADRLR